MNGKTAVCELQQVERLQSLLKEAGDNKLERIAVCVFKYLLDLFMRLNVERGGDFIHLAAVC